MSRLPFHAFAEGGNERGNLFRSLKRKSAPEDAISLIVKIYFWLREQDLNLRPSGYEPDELPGCSIPRRAPMCVVIGVLYRLER